jgi:hypothetical protein
MEIEQCKVGIVASYVAMSVCQEIVEHFPMMARMQKAARDACEKIDVFVS